jgi:PncC family amidohydrolase
MRYKRQGRTLALAESCTGGLVAAALTECAGASQVFLAGYVSYANDAKIAMLGVRPETLEQHGAVSAEVAQEMAWGALHEAQSDVALAITGIAGPKGGTAHKPVGTVYLALVQRGQEVAEVVHMRTHGNRAEIREAAAHKALDILLAA